VQLPNLSPEWTSTFHFEVNLMTWSPDASITGGAQNVGFTNPTFTLASDLAPDSSSRAYVVTALGGTQPATVRVSTAGDPFTAMIRLSRYQAIPPKNPVTGAYGNVPLNRIEVLCRKGVYIDSANTLREARIRVIAELPAGCEAADPANVRALASFTIGLLSEESADYGDSLVTRIV
jgi:hypothetical protein